MIRKSFQIPYEFYEEIERMTDSERSELIRMLVSWAGGKSATESSGVSSSMFRLIKNHNARLSRAKPECTSSVGIQRSAPTTNKTPVQEAEDIDDMEENEKDIGEHPEQSNVIDIGIADQRFAAFWSEYPRKVSKKQAMSAFKRLATSKAKFDEIMEGLNRFKNSYDWMKDGGIFIPYPASWLNAERWKDEIVEFKPKQTQCNPFEY